MNCIGQTKIVSPARPALVNSVCNADRVSSTTTTPTITSAVRSVVTDAADVECLYTVQYAQFLKTSDIPALEPRQMLSPSRL